MKQAPKWEWKVEWTCRYPHFILNADNNYGVIVE